MAFLDSFTHGDALTEIFIEGHNPYAQLKLPEADLDAIRQKLMSSEALLGYVSGRIVGAGRGVWLVTDQAVVIRSATVQGAQRIGLAEVEHFETERGRFGHVVRMKAQGRSWSLFGVDRELAGSLQRALESRGIAGSHDDRPTRSPLWREASPEGWAQDCLRDARTRLALA